jgi:hypothetical protein
MPIPAKTARDLIPSLRGSSFRRAGCDSRTWFVREIMTLSRKYGKRTHSAVPTDAITSARAARH